MLPNNTGLTLYKKAKFQTSKFKAVAYDNSRVVKMIEIGSERAENIVEKEETKTAGYQASFLFSKMLLKHRHNFYYAHHACA